MQQTYAFLFCFALGMASRFLYMGATALAKRTNLLPVTIALDTLTVLAVGASFTAYIILTGAVLAPYMFAALCAGYLIVYWVTKKKRS